MRDSPEPASAKDVLRKKENLVPRDVVLFILSAMKKYRFWLLALFLATLSLSSCMNQEGVAPAEGELKTPSGN